jgi:hypothetical protein
VFYAGSELSLNPMPRITSVLLLVPVLLLACGGPRATPPTRDLSVATVDQAQLSPVDLAVIAGDLALPPMPDLALPDLLPPPDLPGPYPPGPYGNAVGSTLPNMKFQGYFSPFRTMGLTSQDPYGEVSLDMLRTTGAKYALLATAGFT